MDGNRFDALTKILIAGTSRRRTLGGLLGGVFGLVGLAGAGAKSCKKKCEKDKKCDDKKDKKAKKKCRKQCKRKCEKQEDRGGFCAGKSYCVDQTPCGASGTECYCFVTAGSGQQFCGRNANSTDDCLNSPCAAGEICVDFTGCDFPSATVCAVPCPNPQ